MPKLKKPSVLEVNKWIKSIPEGSHGSTSVQKRYWKVVSDYVRIRDFYSFGGICISCNRTASSWEQFQAGHCKSWGACRGYSKWDTLNIFNQCPYCNKSGDALTGKEFLRKIELRHGKKRIEYIEKLSSHPTEKLDDREIVPKIKKVIALMADLKIKPDYYERVIKTMI